MYHMIDPQKFQQLSHEKQYDCVVAMIESLARRHPETQRINELLHRSREIPSNILMSIHHHLWEWLQSAKAYHMTHNLDAIHTILQRELLDREWEDADALLDWI